MNLLTLLPIIFKLLDVFPKIKAALATGGNVVELIKNLLPELLPVLQQLGTGFFPTVTDPVKSVQAAIDVLADKDGTMWVQNSLNKLGQTPPLTVDGLYGKMTTAAVAAYQQSHKSIEGEPLNVDGWSGPKTSLSIAAEVNKLG